MTDLVGMYLQAITFLDCACLCNETSGLEKGSARSIYLGTPVIVNCAFACEIFLKFHKTQIKTFDRFASYNTHKNNAIL